MTTWPSDRPVAVLVSCSRGAWHPSALATLGFAASLMAGSVLSTSAEEAVRAFTGPLSIDIELDDGLGAWLSAGVVAAPSGIPSLRLVSVSVHLAAVAEQGRKSSLAQMYLWMEVPGSSSHYTMNYHSPLTSHLLLLDTHYSLPAAWCWVLGACYSLPATRYLLLSTRQYSLLGAW